MGQSGSALGASAGQDLAAIGGSHSLSEPMDFASLSLFRLIGSEHRSSPPSGSWRRPRRGSLPDVVGHLYSCPSVKKKLLFLRDFIALRRK